MYDYDYDYTFTYESSDPSVATVDENGVVSAVSPGYCYIYVTAGGITTHEFAIYVLF